MRCAVVSVIMLAGFSSAVDAAESKFTEIATDCLSRSESQEIPRQCIDRTTDLCRNETKYPSNVARLNCLSNVRAAWLNIVEAEYLLAVEQAAALDADTLRLREKFKGQIVAPLILSDLKQAHAAWETFVNKDCKVVRLGYGAGSLAGHGQARCEIEHYGERALILRARRMGRMY